MIVIIKDRDKDFLFFRLLIFIFGISMVFFNFYPSVDVVTLRAYFGAGMLSLAILNNDRLKNLSLVLIPLVTTSFGYYIYRYPLTVIDGGFLTSVDILVGSTIIGLVIVVGYFYSPNLLVLVGLFFLFLVAGPFLPYAFAHSGFSFDRIIGYVVWTDQGVLGMPIGVCATYIFLFILFGEFLRLGGLSKFISDLSMALVGDRPGGPAKVAVIASATLGMINGSAVANVATTGMITIPMMIDVGYDKEFAAGIEAASSTGGQFAPPIMGAVGFIMAEYLGLPYSKVMAAAIFPAVLYYFGLLISVNLKAKKLNLEGISKDNLPELTEVLVSRGFLIIPIVLVVVLIVLGYSPIYSGVVGILGTILVSQLGIDKIGVSEIVQGVIKGVHATVGIAIATLLIGTVVAIVSITSLGLNFGNLFMSISSFNNLLIVGLLTMVMSIVLGMGVPGVAAYVVIVSVSVPVLINIGVSTIVAHMFCLIYACLSNITPPVALSSYVAAGIAGADQSRTSIQAVKLGLVGFIVPFFFLYNPELLIGVVEVGLVSRVLIIISSLLGVASLSVATEGVFVRKLRYWQRLLMFIAGLMFIYPGYITDVAALIIIVVVYISSRRGGSY